MLEEAAVNTYRYFFSDSSSLWTCCHFIYISAKGEGADTMWFILKSQMSKTILGLSCAIHRVTVADVRGENVLQIQTISSTFFLRIVKVRKDV